MLPFDVANVTWIINEGAVRADVSSDCSPVHLAPTDHTCPSMLQMLKSWILQSTFTTTTRELVRRVTSSLVVVARVLRIVQYIDICNRLLLSKSLLALSI
jgi:hypothetical protein